MKDERGMEPRSRRTVEKISGEREKKNYITSEEKR
jgi:hypothetical protein